MDLCCENCETRATLMRAQADAQNDHQFTLLRPTRQTIYFAQTFVTFTIFIFISPPTPHPHELEFFRTNNFFFYLSFKPFMRRDYHYFRYYSFYDNRTSFLCKTYHNRIFPFVCGKIRNRLKITLDTRRRQSLSTYAF